MGPYPPELPLLMLPHPPTHPTSRKAHTVQLLLSYQQTRRTHVSLYIHMAQLSHKHKLPCKYNPKLAERRGSSFHVSLGPLPNFLWVLHLVLHSHPHQCPVPSSKMPSSVLVRWPSLSSLCKCPRAHGASPSLPHASNPFRSFIHSSRNPIVTTFSVRTKMETLNTQKPKQTRRS